MVDQGILKVWSFLCSCEMFGLALEKVGLLQICHTHVDVHEQALANAQDHKTTDSKTDDHGRGSKCKSERSGKTLRPRPRT